MLSLIHSCAVKARSSGYRVIDGNSWKGLAEDCGFKTEDRWAARKFIINLFGNERLKSSFKPIQAPKKKNDDAFLQSYEWRQVRMQVLKRDGAKCACCGATAADGRVMNVDHIKPRKHHPELAFNLNNLQVLCEVCNHGKGNWDQTDWRELGAFRLFLTNDLVAELIHEFGAHVVKYSFRLWPSSSDKPK